MTDDKDYKSRFQLLGALAVDAALGVEPRQLLDRAVGDAVASVGLAAGTVRIFADGEEELARAVAGDAHALGQIEELEQSLLAQLRRTWSVKSLFMTLDLDRPAGLFSYPLRSGTSVVGVITGISYGERSLAVEEEFVSYVAAMIVLVGRTGASWSSGPAAIDPAREEAIRAQAVVETGTALNHEINNPLMAVLGNVQLLLRKSPPLDAETASKLAKVQEAAERIRDVTHALVRIQRVQTTPYPGAGRMIDIDNSPKRDEKP